MSRRLLTPWVLVASLLFGLWTTAAHEADHATMSAHPEACAVCAFAGGLGGALLAAVAALVLAAVTDFFAAALPAVPRRVRRAPIRVRGPPAVLA